MRVSVAKAAEEEIAVLLEGRTLPEFRREFGIAELLGAGRAARCR